MPTAAALTAAAFLSTIGVNTHLDFQNYGYQNLHATEQAIRYLGITHLRDDPENPADVGAGGWWQQVADATGARFDAFMAEGSVGQMQDDLTRAQQLAGQNVLDAIEGGNEEDDPYATSNGNSLAQAASFQSSVYAAAHTANLPAINMSFGQGWSADNNYAGNYGTVGDLSSASDYANAHTYPSGAPSSSIQLLVRDALMAASSRPVVQTEFGYDTNSTSQADAAVWSIDGLLDAYVQGVVRTYFYALFDDGAGAFGLMNQDGSPKPAGQAIHDLTTILGGGTTTFTPRPLSYSLNGQPGVTAGASPAVTSSSPSQGAVTGQQLGVYVGVPDKDDPAAQAAVTAQWNSAVQALGQTPTMMDAFIDLTQPESQWVSDAQWEADSWKATSWASGLTPVIGVPMASRGEDADASFKAITSGSEDQVFTGIFQAWAGDGFKTMYIRPGWEMNGSWQPWAVTAGNAADFSAAFAHIATLAHGFSGADIKTVWNPNEGATSVPVTSYYPGASAVDVIGLDAYGAPVSTDAPDDPSTSADTFTVDQALSFAKAQNKPFALPETGGMDANFPVVLAQQVKRAGIPVAFSNLWDVNDESGNLSWSGDPTAAAGWQQLAQAGAAPAPEQPAAASPANAPTGLADGVMSIVMQKTDSTYDVALWTESGGTVPVTLAVTGAALTVYDPIRGTDPTAAGSGSIQVQLGRDPLIIQVDTSGAASGLVASVAPEVAGPALPVTTTGTPPAATDTVAPTGAGQEATAAAPAPTGQPDSTGTPPWIGHEAQVAAQTGPNPAPAPAAGIPDFGQPQFSYAYATTHQSNPGVAKILAGFQNWLPWAKPAIGDDMTKLWFWWIADSPDTWPVLNATAGR